MAPRALGALLAVLAAIAFVVSIASSAWWSGHPDVEGRTITAKAVRVGLLGATGCNTGGDGTCEPVEVTSGMQTAGLVELAAIGVCALLAFMLAVSAWRIGDRRKGLANVTIFAALLAGVGAIGVLLIGPAIHASQSVSVPIGWGTFVFGGGLLALLAGSAITRTLEPEPFRLKPSMAPLPMPPSVRDMLREQHEGLRPSQMSIDPSGSRPSVPLIGGAPQLRPLYDPRNDGYVPAPISPPLPLAPPTPVPQSMIDQLTGNGAPISDAGPPRRGHSPSAPPPMLRGRSPSVPPPARPARPHVPMPARRSGPSVPMPMRPQPSGSSGRKRGDAPPAPPAQSGARGALVPPRSQTHQGHGTDPDARAAVRTSASRISGPALSSTMAHAVPPMPTSENTPVPSKLSGRDGRAQTEADDRLDKAMRPTDYITAVEIDADAKAAAAAQNGDVTETNLKISAQRVPNTSEDEIQIAPPPSRGGAQHGDESSVQKPVTLELAAQTVLTDGDPLGLGQRALGAPGQTGLESLPPSRTTYELAAQTTLGATDPFAGDSGIALGGITDEMAAQRMTGEMLAAEPLTDQLARQQHDGSDVTDPQGPHGTDITGRPDDRRPLSGPSGTDVMRRPDDRLPLSGPGDTDVTRRPNDRRDSRTPMPTHAPRGADHTPIPTHARAAISTAPSHLSPPKPTEVAATGPTPACPQCESPMAWVEEHLRFYCKQCRMYF
jgi:hypothetical protein